MTICENEWMCEIYNYILNLLEVDVKKIVFNYLIKIKDYYILFVVRMFIDRALHIIEKVYYFYETN